MEILKKKIITRLRRFRHIKISPGDQITLAIASVFSFGERSPTSHPYEVYTLSERKRLLWHADQMIIWLNSTGPFFTKLWKLTLEEFNAYSEHLARKCMFSTMISYKASLLKIICIINEYYGANLNSEDLNDYRNEKKREIKLKERFKRCGYYFQKDSKQLHEEKSCGGYRIVEKSTSIIVAGEDFSLTLDDLEDFIV